MRLFVLCGALLAAQLDLLSLKSHWTGNGVSYFAHGALRLLSHRLTGQCGQVSSYLPLPGGPAWTFKGTLTLRCAEKADAGLALLFTRENLVRPHKEYGYAKNSETFGAGGSASGVSVTLHRDNVYVAFFERAALGRDEMLEWAVPCKAGVRPEEGEVALVVRYREATLSVYTFDRVSGTEALCAQFTAIDFLEEFYLTAAGTDEGGKCAGTLTRVGLEVAATPEFVPEAEKTAGTPQFATFADFTPRDADTRHLHRALALGRENAKILLHELLRFADKNEKEVEEDLGAGYAEYLGNLTAAAGVIEREAEHITALSSALLAERQAQHGDTEAMLAQLLKWLESVESVYDSTAAATRRAHAVVAGLALDAQLGGALNDTQQMLAQLKGAFENATRELAPPPGTSLHDADLAGWQRKVAGFAESFNSTVHGAARSRAAAAVQHLGAAVLAALAVTIFLAFGFLYWKVSRIAEFKRVL